VINWSKNDWGRPHEEQNVIAHFARWYLLPCFQAHHLGFYAAGIMKHALSWTTVIERYKIIQISAIYKYFLSAAPQPLGFRTGIATPPTFGLATTDAIDNLLHHAFGHLRSALLKSKVGHGV